MGRARLTRIDAVREMAAAVDAFRNEVMATLEGLDMDLRRAGVDPRRPPRALEPRGPPRLGPHYAGPHPAPASANGPPHRRSRAGLSRRKESLG